MKIIRKMFSKKEDRNKDERLRDLATGTTLGIGLGVTSITSGMARGEKQRAKELFEKLRKASKDNKIPKEYNKPKIEFLRDDAKAAVRDYKMSRKTALGFGLGTAAFGVASYAAYKHNKNKKKKDDSSKKK